METLDIPISRGLAARLGDPMAIVSDSLFETLEHAERNLEDFSVDLRDTWLYGKVPRQFADRVTPRTCRDFIQTLSVLALKILGPEILPTVCRAEELLMFWIVEMVKVQLYY